MSVFKDREKMSSFKSFVSEV